jgi:hypothetical protein
LLLLFFLRRRWRDGLDVLRVAHAAAPSARFLLV